MDYEVILSIVKSRSIYFINQYHITVDHLEGVGEFVEFAIMTDDQTLLAQYKTELKALASEFGLNDTDLEHRSYREMVTDSQH